MVDNHEHSSNILVEFVNRVTEGVDGLGAGITSGVQSFNYHNRRFVADHALGLIQLQQPRF